jgi:MoaA/NifB/PqqE/SkfB family radical SAM enzyme
MEVPKGFCVLAWTGMRVWPDGRLSPCCLNSGWAKAESGEDLYLYKDTMEQAYDSEYFTSLRSSILAGKKDARCAVCWNHEAVGIESRRMRENTRYDHWTKRILAGELPGRPITLDLNIGTLCNLKCRICGPNSSSKWTQEYLDLFGTDHIPRNNDELQGMPLTESAKKLNFWYENNEPFWKTLHQWVPLVERFEFFGGEPFLNLRHFEVLEAAVKGGHAQSQELVYATNGTVFPERAAKEFWPHFNIVSISVSVDGLGPQFEYQRYGADWAVVLRNLERLDEYVDYLQINCTVSIFNAFQMPEFLGFFADRKVRVVVTYLHGPERFCLRSLPIPLKERVARHYRESREYNRKNIADQLEQIIEFMKLEDRPDHFWEECKTSIAAHDAYRKQSFKEVFADFSYAAEEAGLW